MTHPLLAQDGGNAATTGQRVAPPSLTVIIPTMASTARSLSLLCAISSACAASRHPIVVIVVANGERVDEAVLGKVRRLGAHVVRESLGSAPNARLVGRRLVRTEHYCFIDDDDEYLPGALDRLVAILRAEPSTDLVVSNGRRRALDGSETVYLGPFDSARHDPLLGLFESNWMSNCGAVFRTATMPAELFDGYHAFVEATLLGYKIALAGKRIVFDDEPAYLIHETAASASGSTAYVESLPALFGRMRALGVPARLRAVMQRQQSAAWHDLAEHRRQRGRLAGAWSAHWRSLWSLQGLAYVPATRHLVVATAQSLWHRAAATGHGRKSG